jgi:hypothetical protein
MQRWISAAAAILVSAPGAAGQTPGEKCRVEGTVLNAITGRPVRKARISLLPGHSGEPMMGVTDAQGRYVFPNVPPGTYTLMATRDGYIEQRYGAKKFGGDQKGDELELAAGSVKSAVDLHLTPLGSILGFVRDEDGDPVRQVEVAVLAYGYGPSGKGLQESGGSQTDALGEYRIFDLHPGTYYLRAKPLSAQSPGMGEITEAYTTVYYPNSLQQAGAGALELAAGQEQRGVDFVLHPMAVSFVRGHVIKPMGADKCWAALEAGEDELQPSFGDAMESGFVTMVSGAFDGVPEDLQFGFGPQVDKDGKFEFRNVPVGSHSLKGSCLVGKQRYATRMPVQLETSGLDNVELRPVGPSTITGQLRLEGESKSKLTDTRISAGQTGSGTFYFHDVSSEVLSPDGRPAEDGTFSIHNLGPDVYHLNVRPPKDLYVKSITEDGRDIQESGIDLNAGGMSIALQVVLSANGGSIEGTVENGAGASVILLPSDPQAVRTQTKMAMAGPDGRFAFPVLAPGSYKLFAWEQVDMNAAMYDREFRKPFEAKAQSVEVEEKQKATVQLQLIPKVEK